MTCVADCVEKACLLAFGNCAKIEENGPSLNAGHHRRFAVSQGASPCSFRDMRRGNGALTLTAIVGIG